jgi:hypothetical protein
MIILAWYSVPPGWVLGRVLAVPVMSSVKIIGGHLWHTRCRRIVSQFAALIEENPSVSRRSTASSMTTPRLRERAQPPAP